MSRLGDHAQSRADSAPPALPDSTARWPTTPCTPYPTFPRGGPPVPFFFFGRGSVGTSASTRVLHSFLIPLQAPRSMSFRAGVFPREAKMRVQPVGETRYACRGDALDPYVKCGTVAPLCPCFQVWRIH